MTKPFSIHFFSIAVCLALSNFHKFGNCHSVEKVDTIAKLKNYFNHLGYIPNSPSNFTNDFDDDLELALRTYQKNFNLNVTGELDDLTLRHVERPRCGHPDIVNGINTMASRKKKKPTSSAEFNGSKLHAVAHYNFLKGHPVWGHGILTYAFDGVDLGDVDLIFENAFATWSKVVSFSFKLVKLSDSPDIKIKFVDPAIDVNFNGALAYAYGPPDGRIYINKNYDWSLTGTYDSLKEVVYDLETVAIHEIGHVLGLGHSSLEDSVMWPTIKPWTRRVSLYYDDIMGLITLYGERVPTTTSSPPVLVTEEATPPAPPTETTNAAADGNHSARSCCGLGVLLAVGFLLM